jgi:hypothetical protein
MGLYGLCCCLQPVPRSRKPGPLHPLPHLSSSRSACLTCLTKHILAILLSYLESRMPLAGRCESWKYSSVASHSQEGPAQVITHLLIALCMTNAVAGIVSHWIPTPDGGCSSESISMHFAHFEESAGHRPLLHEAADECRHFAVCDMPGLMIGDLQRLHHARGTIL